MTAEQICRTGNHGNHVSPPDKIPSDFSGSENNENDFELGDSLWGQRVDDNRWLVELSRNPPKLPHLRIRREDII